MATSVYNFANDDLLMRWQQPFLTQGLNQKANIVIPSGVYRGFRIIPSATAMCIDIQGDPIYSDNICVINTVDGYSITVKKTTGLSAISLSASASSTVVVGIVGFYDVGATTTGNIKTYSESEYVALSAANKAEIVVLGTVVVPSSGTIPTANITPSRRNSAWSRIAREANLPSSLIRNGGFEITGASNSGQYSIPYWEQNMPSNANWISSIVSSNTGAKSLELNVLDTNSITGELYQNINTPVVSGQFLKVQCYLRVITASLSSASSVLLFVEWGSNTGAVAATSTSALGVNATNGVFTLVDVTFEAPVSATHIKRIGIKIVSASYATATTSSVKFRIDDFSSFLETIDEKSIDSFETKISEMIASPLLIKDPAALFSEISTLIRYSNATTEVIGERSDQSSSATQVKLNWKGALTVGENLLDSESEALQARVTIQPSVASLVDYTFMWNSTPSGNKGLRMYITPIGTYVLTHNCSWNGTLWTKDITTQTAVKLEYSNAGLALYSRTAALTTTFDDTVSGSGWINKQVDLNNVSLSNIFTGRVELGADLLATTANAILPRIRMSSAIGGVSARTLLIDSGDGQTLNTRTSRIYTTPTGTLEFTSNAFWDGVQWLSDDISVAASKLLVNEAAMTLYQKVASAGGWDDGISGGTGWSKEISDFNLSDLSDNNISGSLELGAGLLDNASNALKARLKLPLISDANSRTLLLSTEDDTLGNATVLHTNMYASTGIFEIASNCRFNGTNWERTNTTNTTSSKIVISSSGKVSIFRKAINSPSWLDSAWDTGSDAALILDASSPAIGSEDKNSLYAKNTPKAWCSLQAGPDATIFDAFGFENTMSFPSANLARLTFSNPMSSENYAVATTCAMPLKVIPQVYNKTVNGFDIGMDSAIASTWSAVDFTIQNILIDLVVFGTQV